MHLKDLTLNTKREPIYREEFAKQSGSSDDSSIDSDNRDDQNIVIGQKFRNQNGQIFLLLRLLVDWIVRPIDHIRLIDLISTLFDPI